MTALCKDCGTERANSSLFLICPPEGRAEGHSEPFFLCTFCWDRLIGLATMAAIR